MSKKKMDKRAEWNYKVLKNYQEQLEALKSKGQENKETQLLENLISLKRQLMGLNE